MPRDLFGNVTRPSISVGSRKWYTLPVSLISHTLALAALIAVPLLAAPLLPSIGGGALPEVYIPVTPPPPPLPRQPNAAPPLRNINAAPITAPDTIEPEKPLPAGFENAQPSIGIVDGIADMSGIVAPPPPKIDQPPPAPVRVGFQGIRSPVKTRDAAPIYPAMAQAAHVQGIVIIEATISVDGHVVNARVLRSMPLLDQAALDAVRQWEFTPTLLNGVPVPVIMTVTVNFTLK